jgi:hypothetical protein
LRISAYVIGTSLLGALIAPASIAHEIKAKPGNAPASFDIQRVEVKAEARWVTFRMLVADKVGKVKPAATGKLGGAEVVSYVWPTKIDTGVVGFAAGQGTLALAVTAHPDFDDTPLFDENRDGDRDNDGNIWHTHWVVLVPDNACGQGALKVKDIEPGTQPKLPSTWPGLPILIDSPGYTPILRTKSVEVRVPFADPKAIVGQAFDGVTAGLRVNANVHAPLLCVVAVHDVASGDLSLPGRVE